MNKPNDTKAPLFDPVGFPDDLSEAWSAVQMQSKLTPAPAPKKPPEKRKKISIWGVISVLFCVWLLVSELAPGLLWNKGELHLQTPDQAICFHYRQLNEEEQRLYSEILQTTLAGKTALKTSWSEETNIKKVFRAVRNDHPECFWLDNGRTKEEFSLLSGRQNDKTFMLDNWDHLWKYQNVQKACDQMEAIVQGVVAEANQLTTDAAKARYVHDYLITHADYATEELAEYEQELGRRIGNKEETSSYAYIYTCYGCLVYGRAVCAGYAQAFELLMNRLGIPCTYVIGDTDRGSHAWNMVYLDGRPYYVDVTWDDFGNQGYPDPYYDYFCISTKELLESRTIDEEFFTYPNCDKRLTVQ